MPHRVHVVAGMSRLIAQHAVDVLNEAFKADPDAIAALVANRIPCNKALESHPEITCMEKGGNTVIGMFGVMVGMVERQSGMRICAKFEDKEAGKLIGFGILDDVLKAGPSERVKKLP